MASSGDTVASSLIEDQFDDEFTIRRKQAYFLSKHFDTLIKLDGEYVNLEEKDGYYAKYFRKNPDSTFIQMYEELIEEYDYLFVFDIIMSFSEYIKPINISEREDILDEFRVIDGNRRYDDKTEFLNMYRIWSNARQNFQEENEKRFEIINTVQDDLKDIENKYQFEDTIEKLVSSKVVYTNISIVINPTGLDGEKITLIDGLNIFNNSVVSKRVPFIKYNDSEKSRYKIFSGDNLTDVPNYDNIDIPESESNLEHIIYLKLWVENVGFLSKAAKKDLIKVIYNLKFNRITFTLPEVFKNIKDDEAIQYLKETFPNLSLDKVNKSDIKGHFNIFRYERKNDIDKIYDLSFEEYSLVEAITSGLDINRPRPEEFDKNAILLDQWIYLLGTYLYLDEVEKPNADKTALKMNYRSLTSELDLGESLLKDFNLATISKVSFELVNDKIKTPEDFDITDTKSTIRVESDRDYIHVRVSAKNERDLKIFIKLLKLLLYIYNLTKSTIEDKYEEILGAPFVDSLIGFQKIYKGEEEPSEKEESRRRKLKKLASDIFVSKYPKLCANAPIAIPEDKLDYWRNQAVPIFVRKEDGNFTKEFKPRQVLSFPKDNPKYHFVCDNVSTPYIGLVKNTLSNKDVYPRLPCCYQTDHQDPNTSSEYNKEYRNMRFEPRNIKNKGMIKGRMILAPNRYGELPTTINDALKLYSERDVKFNRYGVIRSKNSLIHSLCKATSDRKYLELEALPDMEKSETGLENHVELIRQSLIEDINVFRQELYDLSDGQIRDALWDNDIFFDPKLFYRGLEELFGLNLFVFIPESDSSKDGDIEVPRSWLFHVISRRPDRKTVLIYKHSGSSRDSSEYPQCEIIVQNTPDGHIAVFDQNTEMYKVCYNIMVEQIKTLTWFPEGDIINGNRDIYTGVNYNQMIGYSAHKQFIDKYGKCRALTFQVSMEDKLYDMSIAIPPSQPESLPLIEGPNELYRTHHTIATAIFGDFTKVDLLDGNVIGLWFKVFDINQGVYVPIIPTPAVDFGPNILPGDANPIFGHQTDKANRYSKLKRDITIFLELLKWLYEIYKLENGIPDGNVDDFFLRYIKRDDYNGDSIDYYDLSSIDYKLPSYDNVNEALDYIRNYTNMVTDKVVMAYNKEFYEQIYEYLIRYNTYTEGLQGNPSRYISDYFQSANNFKSGENTMLFLNSKGYREWLERMIFGPFKVFDVIYDVDLNKAKLLMPYIINKDDRYYIVQNVLKGEYARAINVAIGWLRNKVNLGFNADHVSIEDFNQIEAVTYGVTKQTLTQIAVTSARMPDIVEVLRYGGEDMIRYAAMLPLN